MKKIINFSLLLLLAVSLFLHLHATWHQSLFGDEIHSLFFFQNNTYQELLSTPVEPIHPNTYYILLKTLYSLTPSVLALRLWMFGFFITSVYIVYLISKKIFTPRSFSEVGLLPTAYATSAYLWHFSHQLRMYGLSMLTILLSLYLLLKNKKYLSVIFDWLSIMTTYGALIFVIAKWMSWLTLQLFSKNKTQKHSAFLYLPPTLALAPIPFVLANFVIRNPIIDSNYLYWVHTPVPADFSLGLISFISGMFLPYFEGYAPLSGNILIVGNLLNLLIIIFFLFLIAFGFKNKKKIFSQPIKITLLTTAYSLLAYLILFTYSLITHSHLFHIRQMFSIGVMLILSLPILLTAIAKIYQKLLPTAYSLLLSTILLIYFSTNLLAIVSDSLPEHQTYPHHFTTIPGTPLITSPTDIELIYKQCDTFDRSKQNEKCNQKGIYLNNQDINPEILANKFWTTTNAHSQLNCSSISIDYWECQGI